MFSQSSSATDTNTTPATTSLSESTKTLQRLETMYRNRCASVLLGVLVASTLQRDFGVGGEHTELCRLFKDGMQLRKPGSCTEYIECNDSIGVEYACASTQLYDRNKQTCVDAAMMASDRCGANRCEGQHDKWLTDPTNCHGYLYCYNGLTYQGYCPSGYHFEQSSQLCGFDTSSYCVGVGNICEIMPDKTKFRDENDCSKYYECANGVHKHTTCKKNAYFNVNTGACIDKWLVNCTAHPLPSNVCGTKTTPKPGFKTDGATCRGYFYCKNLGIVPDLEPVWGQCPVGMFFDTNTATCLEPINAFCTNNRCEGRKDMMVQSSSNNCRNYIVCKNGYEVSQHACSGDMFFDEVRQACVHDIVYHKCCDGSK